MAQKSGSGGRTVAWFLFAAAIGVMYFSAHICISQIKHDHHDRKPIAPGGLRKNVELENNANDDIGTDPAAEIKDLKGQLRNLKGLLDQGENAKVGGDDVRVYRRNGKQRKLVNPGGGTRQGHNFIPEYAPAPTITLAVLCRNEFASLEYSMKTWEKNGLINYVDEVLIFFNALSPGYRVEMEKLTLPSKAKVISSEVNVPIMAAVNWLVGNVSSDLVLFLEKDFVLIEDEAKMREQMDIGRRLLDREEAQVVRYRHRKFPGEPHYAEYIFKGREQKILSQQPNLFCHIVHWLKDPVSEYPDKIWTCRSESKMYCTRAEYCGWTNNPQLFARDWWMRNFKDTMDVMYPNEFPASDLEYFMNWNARAWTPKAFFVALGDGLFEHKELKEHQEVDYSSMRDRVFREDADAKAKAEAKAKELAENDKKISVTRNVEWVKRGHEILRDKYGQSHDTPLANILNPPYVLDEKGSITIVTCLFDLMRGNLTEFKRPFETYIEHLKNRFMAIKMPKIIFCEAKTAELIKDAVDDQTEIRIKTLKDVEALLGPGNFDRITKLRTNPKWFDKGWLKNSPQALLPHYNAVVMTKIFLQDEAAKWNPFKTKYILWLDAKHNCINADKFTYDHMGIFYEHMNGAFLMTYYNYGPNVEVHGFEWEAMNRYSDRALGTTSRVKVVRGGVFGGTPPYISAIADLYYLALNATLHDGVMGTEENVFSIVMYNFPKYVREFSNDDACGSSTELDHSCRNFQNGQNNCAMFSWAYDGPPKHEVVTAPPPPAHDVYQPPTNVPPTKAGPHKFWRIIVTKDGGKWEWAVHEVEMYNRDGQNLLDINMSGEVTIRTNAGGAWGQAADGLDNTFWDLPTPNNEGNTLELNCRKPQEVHTVRLLQHGHKDNSVEAIAVEYSDDGRDWTRVSEATNLEWGKYVFLLKPE